MPAHPATVLVISPSEITGERIARWLANGPAPCEVRQATSLRHARRLIERLLPAAIFLEETVLSGEEVRSATRELAQFAPVVAAVSPESARALAVLVVAGTADCVPEGEDFLDHAAALIERRLLSARRLLERIEEADTEEVADFGSILRHELNNPLTGILGNAEMLLNHRQWLPQDAVPRLETIADLAVRLRETIRRLSGAWMARQRPQHIG
ncbi:MAG TPA: histidine kinase dimerization/phospho-acceptor domain-containing protein [Candidatus Acidoferrales bacterium]|nr:histidine kinase dimerization/phospho-acceptor domain-containing protein [Candidatus Acidoferrales bacterium]